MSTAWSSSQQLSAAGRHCSRNCPRCCPWNSQRPQASNAESSCTSTGLAVTEGWTVMLDDPAGTVRGVIDASLYMVLAAADETGRPWATPVYLASLGYRARPLDPGQRRPPRPPD